MSKKYWDDVYSTFDINKKNRDFWLDKHKQLLINSINVPILDLGCGLGNDTLYLIDRGYEVISCDFSEEALKKLSESNSNVKTRNIDIRDKLPFEDNSAKIIISDLSLHYFSWSQTKKILSEFSRVLDDNGIIICRVNSTNDFNHGAGLGTVIEHNYYKNSGNYKRFFDEEHLRELFKNWNINYIKETNIARYRLEKVAWEIVIDKTGKSI